jgi:hypothetical protein
MGRGEASPEGTMHQPARTRPPLPALRSTIYPRPPTRQTGRCSRRTTLRRRWITAGERAPPAEGACAPASPRSGLLQRSPPSRTTRSLKAVPPLSLDAALRLASSARTASCWCAAPRGSRWRSPPPAKQGVLEPAHGMTAAGIAAAQMGAVMAACAAGAWGAPVQPSPDPLPPLLPLRDAPRRWRSW